MFFSLIRRIMVRTHNPLQDSTSTMPLHLDSMDLLLLRADMGRRAVDMALLRRRLHWATCLANSRTETCHEPLTIYGTP